MNLTKFAFAMITSLIMVTTITAQDYFFKDKAPFNPDIPSPEEFLGRPSNNEAYIKSLGLE